MFAMVVRDILIKNLEKKTKNIYEKSWAERIAMIILTVMCIIITQKVCQTILVMLVLN